MIYLVSLSLLQDCKLKVIRSFKELFTFLKFLFLFLTLGVSVESERGSWIGSFGAGGVGGCAPPAVDAGS